MEDDAAVTEPLPIWRTASGAIGFAFENIGTAFLMGITVMVGAAAILFLTLGSAFSVTAAQDGGIEAQAMYALTNAWYLGVMAVFTVFFHRKILVGKISRVRLRVGKREGLFFLASVLYLLLLFLMQMGFGAVLGGFGVTMENLSGGAIIVLALIMGGVTALVAIRTALVFPAISVDAEDSLLGQFKRSILATRGNFRRLFTIYFLAYGILAVMYALASAFIGMVGALMGLSINPFLGVMVLMVFGGIAGGMGVAVFASIASQAFLALSGWRPEQAPTETPV